MSNENHLPVFGVGPYMLAPLIIISVISLLLNYYNIIPKYEIKSLNFILIIIAVILIIVGAIFWLSSVTSRIDVKIKQNILVTTGIYGIIRHPIYACFLYIASALIVISQNIYLFFLPVVYWIFLTIAVKNTEEKWLIDLYGKDYIDYSKKVNRFIPKVL